MTTPHCHCGHVLEVSRHPIPTAALAGESGPKSLQILALQLLTPPSTTSSLCHRVPFLLTPMCHMCLISPRPGGLGSPSTALVMCPSAPPTYMTLVPQSSLLLSDRLVFSSSLFLPSISPPLALLSRSELKPRPQASSGRSCRDIPSYTWVSVSCPSSTCSMPQQTIGLQLGFQEQKWSWL